MSVTSKLKRGVDLPMWEWLRPLPVTTVGPSTFATGGKPYGRYIYYLPTTTNIPYRYDIYTDGWTSFTTPPQSQTTVADTTYNDKHGYTGRILSIPSSTSFKACVPKGNKCVGKTVRIILGTGIGQSRTITAVSAPIVHDTLTVSTASTVNITDATKAYTINQWRDYGARIVSNTASDFRKIIHNASNVLTFADNQFSAVGLPWAYSPLPFATIATDGSETRVQIESYDVTVDSAWTTTPDNTSVFLIEGGMLWNVNVVVARFGFQSYDVLSDSWFQNNSIAGGMLNGNLATDITLETLNESSVGVLVTRNVSSATATTVTLSGAAIAADIYSNYLMRVTAGTGFGQVRNIRSHTGSNVFTNNRAWSPTLDATSIVDIIADNDKLYMTGSAAAAMLEYDAVNDVWSDRRILEVNCPTNLCAVWGGFKRPIGITTITAVGALATVTTTNPHGLITGDSVTIFGTTLAAYNITATITVLTATTFTYTMGSSPVSPAVAANLQSTTQLVDPSKSWVTNEHVGKIVTFTTTAFTATGGLQTTYFHRIITANTATVITFATSSTAPTANTTVYMITDMRAHGGVVTGQIVGTPSTTAIQISGAAMGVNVYSGLRATVVDGVNWGEVSIASNTATTVNFTAALGFTPTTTGFITILGVAPTGAGCSLKYIYGSSYLQKGRYMFGLRGAATNYMYFYDCNTNTWDSLNQMPNSETFAAGTMTAYDGADKIYIQRDATGRVLYYDISDNNLYSYNTIPYAMSTAIIGNRMSIIATEDNVKFLYIPRHSATEFWRSLLWI
jgi:hypothetical protein